MLFNSLPFVCFLVATVLLYYLLPKSWKWQFLLVASYAFYAIADWRYLIFITVTTVAVYVASIGCERLNNEQKKYISDNKATLTKDEKNDYKSRMKRKRRLWLVGCLFVTIGILSVTKYTNFVIDNINSVLSGTASLERVELIVPMGISFYTFQSVGYVIDVYRGKQEAQRNFFKLALFVSFFPQLVQGPISRYGDLSQTLYTPHSFDRKIVSYGAMRILWGYFKKVVIADRLITGVTALIGNTAEYNGSYVFVAMLFYAFQLYCDFTGGIDITIGIAESMGIRLAENFNLPFLSKSTKEYWNRWHITMGSWFTDYIFYPISVSKLMLKLSKWSREHLPKAVAKRLPVYLSSFVVWFTTGLWHGAAWNFIVWGLANYAVIMISQELEPLYAKFHSKFKVSGTPYFETFRILRTVFLMSSIRMFDCYRDVPTTFRMIWSMFARPNLGIFTDGSLLDIGLSLSDYALLLVGLLTVLSVSIIKNRGIDIRTRLYERSGYAFYNVMALLAVVILVFGAYGVGYDASQFIYNQF